MSTAYYPKPEILAGPGLEKGHAVIEASAGTGKTFTLEHMVLELIINKNANIEEILVVTFTDAATRELRERVRALIRKVCDKGLTEIPEEKPCWEINDVTRGRLREALFRFDGAAISTIHGFCQRILTEQAFLGGRLFEQEHADGGEMFGLAFREEVRTVLAESGPVGIALKGWMEQGKTFQSLQELLYRCHREGCPERCPVTPYWDPEGFMEWAARFPEKEEVKADLESILRENASRNGYEKLLDRLYETMEQIENASGIEEAAERFLQWAGKECTINKEKKTHFDHVLWAAQKKSALESVKNTARIVEEMAQRAASAGSFFVHELLPRVQERLAMRKRSLGLMDYDDMLLGVREALNGPGARVLLDALRKRWKYALVDEFQDTDPVQWEIFRRIFVESNSNHRLFVIGDPKQAIYGFRGADVHTYERAKKYLLNESGASRLPLLKSFRSTESFIQGVNEILTVEDNHGRPFFRGLNSYDEPVECGDCSRKAVEGGRPAQPVHLVHLYGEEENLSATSVRQGLACFIAGEIKRLTGRETGLAAGKGSEAPSPIGLEDIFILTRSRREGMEIGEVLRRYGIAHAFYKMDGLFDTPEAEDIHRLLHALDSPADPAARSLAWLTNFFGVPLEEITGWQEMGDNHPLAARLLRWRSLAADQEWSSLFDEILTGSGLVRRLIFADGERALTNYLHLFEVLLAEAHTRPVTLRELTRWLKARIDGRLKPEGREGDLQRLETDRDAVQILTMHKAKGLEAEVVFIGGGFGNPGGSPDIEIYHRNNRRCLHIGKAFGEIAEAIEGEKEEENRRLAYVAMTRARSRLYLPYFGPPGEGAPEDRCYGYARLGSFYINIQRQLDLLCERGRFDNKSPFFLREASCRVRPPRDPGGEIDLQGWPGEKLLEPLPARAGEAEQLKPGRRGILLTSYTRMKQGQNWQAPAALDGDSAEWRSDEVEGEPMVEKKPAIPGEPDEAIPAGDPVLPAGREAGIFLHALLEETGPAEIGQRTYAEWSALPAVQERAAAAARRHGFTEEYLPYSLQVVYWALRTPINVESRRGNAVLSMPEGIAAGSHQRPEMSFAYPIPEKDHPLLAAGSGAVQSGAPGKFPFRALRGYLQGLIDLVFQHRGKIYLLDWKSDSLPAFDEDSLDAHVQANYELQAKVYLQALMRLLDLHSEEQYESRFGGILYIFIRGIRPEKDGRPGEGVWFFRPSRDEVAAWEKELLERREWGGEVIELQETAGEGWE